MFIYLKDKQVAINTDRISFFEVRRTRLEPEAFRLIAWTVDNFHELGRGKKEDMERLLFHIMKAVGDGDSVIDLGGEKDDGPKST